MSETAKSVLLNATKITCGVLVFVLFRWTPTTGKGILIYATLFVIMIALIIALSPRNRVGYWPDKNERH
jgi:hypothetical protein